MGAVNRDVKTQAALLALARTRRMQRALAHAYLHRDAPLLGLSSSLGYMVSTAYVVEEIGETTAPIVYRLYLRGPRQGYLVPLHAWYESAEAAREIPARIAALVPLLEPVRQAPTEAWMLSTRIVQRRALRVGSPAEIAPPIRKFALQLVIEPVSGSGPSGRTTATAFLQPHAQLAEVWSLARSAEDRCDAAIARVTFTGIPSGVGLAKDTVVLLTTGLPDEAKSPD
jgi:hypothetical protein